MPKPKKNKINHAKHDALKKKILGGSTSKAHSYQKSKYGKGYEDMSGASTDER